MVRRLNPCFNGRWSRTLCQENLTKEQFSVLILVLMEDGLGRVPPWPCGSGSCLNPCFNGIWSRTLQLGCGVYPRSGVLILVLMEYGLVHSNLVALSHVVKNVLILVLMEYGLVHVGVKANIPQLLVLILVLMEYGLVPRREWCGAPGRAS